MNSDDAPTTPAPTQTPGQDAAPVTAAQAAPTPQSVPSQPAPSPQSETPAADVQTAAPALVPGEPKPAPAAFDVLMAQTSGVELNVRTLIDAGAHFGHQTERWNPKMLPFIYGERNGVHVINLDITLRAWKRARDYVFNKVSNGGTILFVGTKVQAREAVEEQAKRCGAYFINTRWLGGTLTNFQTIKKSLERMRRLEDLLKAAADPESKIRLNKKERLTISRQLERLEGTIGGIRSMRRAPDVIFVLDVNKEDIAVAEARRLKIPIVALVDTNVDPRPIDFPVPANDDAARAITLFMTALADVVIEAKKVALARNIRPDEGDGGSGETRPHRRGDRDRRGDRRGGGDHRGFPRSQHAPPSVPSGQA